MKWYIRTPAGAIDKVDSSSSEHVLAACGCTLSRGTVCNHGYRADLRELRMNGDGLPVVAVDRETSRRRCAWERGLDAVQRATLVLLPASSVVEVLLYDGRVVRSTTRCKPWNGAIAGEDALVMPEGFVGGYSITRVRLVEWTWSWTHRLPPVTS